MQNNLTGFHTWNLSLRDDMYNELSSEVDFEDFGKGRKAQHLVKASSGGIPLVRSTSKFDNAAQEFSQVHDLVASEIISHARADADLQIGSICFDHALIEIYDKSYFRMKYHSDQALDLQANSFIALFSCYERPDEILPPLMRRLKIRNKETNEEYEFLLENNSVVFFSLKTNSKYQHKIILDTSSREKDALEDNKWLGVTFRKSNTMIQFRDNQPCFENGQKLILADETQQREFYKLRGEENKNINFSYPWVGYTVSKGDVLFPK